jgi:hypothetical protein
MNLYIFKDGQQLGPYTLDQARGLFAAGTVQLTDLAWHEGLTDWIPLQRVQGFSAPSPQPASIAPSVPNHPSSPAFQQSGRPVLVWIISIFYFICSPLALVALAITPHLLFPASRAIEGYEIQIHRALERATDPAVKERLLKVQQRVHDRENQINSLTQHGIIYNATAIFSSLLGFVGAVYLFQLRRQALPLFLIATVLALFQNISVYAGGGFFSNVHSIGFAINLVVILLIWSLTIAILYYVWRLSQRGVLS